MLQFILGFVLTYWLLKIIDKMFGIFKK
jgi:hypothetical protein